MLKMLQNCTAAPSSNLFARAQNLLRRTYNILNILNDEIETILSENSTANIAKQSILLPNPMNLARPIALPYSSTPRED
jgi:hypothetical protein